jgi:rubrerythrin
MDDQLVIVSRYGSSAEAHAARLALDGEGIEAVVGDDAAADMLSIMTPGLGGAKLLVFSRHLERARQILAHEDAHKRPPLPAWLCHQCGSAVNAGFAVCWSCGAEFDPARSELAPPGSIEEDDEEDAASFVAHARRAEIVEDERPPAVHLEAGEWRCPGCGLYVGESYTACPACGASAGDAANPYAPALSESGMDHGDFTPRATETPDISLLVLRAWRAAVIGLVVCPGVSHLYSLWLLLRVAMSGQELTPQGNRRFYVALAIDLLALPALAWSLSLLLGR